jgi:cell division septation protein DedD
MRFIGRRLILAGAACALALGAGAARADVNTGVRYWQAGKFPEAVAEWRPLADKGDADAQYNLGQAYKLGRGVQARDLAIAASWYQKAAQQGHEPAQANLALLLYTEGKKAAAMPWLRKCADAGDPRCQFILGGELFNGDLLHEDQPRAYAYTKRAADQGLPQAAHSLATMESYIQAPVRQQGLALAQQMEKNEMAAASGQNRGRMVRIEVGPRTILPANTALASTLPATAPARGAAAPPPAQRPAPAAGPVPGHALQTPHAAAIPAHSPPPARLAVQASAGGWKIQLGAFSSAANARRAWDGIKGKGLAGLQPVFAAAGAVTRLQAGPLASKAAAEKACGAAKAAGSACFPVAP